MFPSAKPRVTKQIDDWKFIPTTGGTVSLYGFVGGVRIQTSPVLFARTGEVMTQNIIYKLGEMLPGVWMIQLELMRPEKARSLREHGVL